MTLNPVNPDLLSRSANHCKPYAKHTTADKDITQHRWLLVDFDPKRPSGISSTDVEHQSALDRAAACATYLESIGCPPDAIVLADSGNGGHLLIRIDLPNNADNSALLKDCLQALDFRFSDDTAGVDVSTYNAARISKLYGTLTAKGDSTPERPHRVARLIKAPPQLSMAPKEVLEKLAAMVLARPKLQTNRRAGARFDVTAWIAKHGLKVSHSKPWNGGTAWVLAVCPWDPAHCRGEAYILQFPDGAIAAGCHHNSCAGKTWSDLRQMFESLVDSTSGGPTVTGKGSKQDNDRKSQATKLVELAADVEFFHTPDGDAYATIAVETHFETWPLHAKGFRRWLLRRYYKESGKAPSTQAFNEARGVMEGQAQYDGQEHSVFTRLAEHDGAIYFDLVNPQWEVIEITGQGWQLVSDFPIKFRRSRGMLSLPYPSPGGSLEELRRFLNIASDDDWVQIKGWLVQACRPKGPYPVLILNGEAGSTKTTLSRMLRSLIDPNSAALRSAPREIRDLMIAANNAWIVAFDNISYLPPWLSDAICRLATGGGFATRELYTDQEEVIFEAMRPVILNSIEEIVARGDLMDRSISLTLPQLPEDHRRPEKELWSEFRVACPRLIGALLDAVATALRNEPCVQLNSLPRMADFAIWATAAEPALSLKPGAFMRAYATNREAANETVLENSPVAAAVLTLMDQGEYDGTPTQFLKTLDELVDEDTRKWKSWPKSTKKLRGDLTRLAPHLRAIGIDVKFGKTPGSGSRRTVSIRKVGHATGANDALDIKTSLGKPAQTNTQPTQQDLEVAQSQVRSDGCVTCASSEPLISVPAAAGDDSNSQADTFLEPSEAQQPPTPSETDPNTYEEWF